MSNTADIKRTTALPTATQKLQTVAARLRDARVELSLWKDRRIYLKGLGRDANVYFHYPEGDRPTATEAEVYARRNFGEGYDPLLVGGTLEVTVELGFGKGRQTDNWMTKRRAQITASAIRLFAKAGLVAPEPDGDELELPGYGTAYVDEDEDVITVVFNGGTRWTLTHGEIDCEPGDLDSEIEEALLRLIRLRVDTAGG